MADVSMKEKLEKGWLHVNIIIEILGKPSSYIEKVLSLAVDKLAQEKNLELLSKKLHPAKLVPDAKEVFTVFAEVELLVNGMAKIVDIIFDYMPSSIEIVEPTSMNFKLEDANALLNDLALKMHQYDALAKQFRLERDFLAKKLKELKNGKEKKP